MVSGMTMYNLSHSEPSAIADAEFLLFLADSVEQDGQLLDALTMVEGQQAASVNDAKAENMADSSATIQLSLPSQPIQPPINTKQENSHE